MGQKPTQGFVSFRELQAPAPTPPPQAAAPAAGSPWGNSSADMQLLGDVATGAGKGVANTLIGLGGLVNRVPGIHQINQAIYGDVPQATYDAARREFATPANTAQQIGFGGEQLGEFFLPVGEAGQVAKLGSAARVAKVADVTKSGALTLAQGGSPTAAGVSAGLTAVLPGGGAATRAAGMMERGAQKEMAQALGATKEVMKSTAGDLAPGMLARGVKGSRAAMLEQATAKVDAVGAQIGAEIQAAAKAGKTVAGDTVRNAIRQSAAPLHVMNAQGMPIPIAGAEAAVKQLRKLDTFVGELGADIPYDKAAAVKTAWDRIVSKAGLYGPKATASATDNANAWAIRESASAFRDLLAQGSPSIDALNQEFKFWKGLKSVLVETGRRTQAQANTGLVAAGTGGAGAIVGAMSGDSYTDKAKNALIGGLAGRQLTKAIQSPAFRTAVSGPLKQILAEALASGNAERINAAVGRVVAAMPAQFSPATSPP